LGRGSTKRRERAVLESYEVLILGNCGKFGNMYAANGALFLFSLSLSLSFSVFAIVGRPLELR